VTGPTGPAATFIQSGFSALAVDTTSASNVFVDLLTVAINVTTGPFLYINASAGISSVLGLDSADFRLTIDGSPVVGTGAFLSSSNLAETVSLVWRESGVAAGAHTVKLQWRGTNIGRTLQCRPVTSPDSEHASLYVAETTV
jgi:hypothetical protein